MKTKEDIFINIGIRSNYFNSWKCAVQERSYYRCMILECNLNHLTLQVLVFAKSADFTSIRIVNTTLSRLNTM